MATTTARTTHEVTGSYTDMTVSIPEAATPGFARHFSGREAEIIKGGAAKPDDATPGIPFNPKGDEWCDAAHIWVICRAAEGAVIGFDALS